MKRDDDVLPLSVPDEASIHWYKSSLQAHLKKHGYEHGFVEVIAVYQLDRARFPSGLHLVQFYAKDELRHRWSQTVVWYDKPNAEKTGTWKSLEEFGLKRIV